MTTAAPYLRLTVLLNPAEDTGRQLLEARHRDGGIEGLEEGVHDALKHVELDLVRDLVLPLMGVVLVRLHNLLIVPESEQARPEGLQQLSWPQAVCPSWEWLLWAEASRAGRCFTLGASLGLL